MNDETLSKRALVLTDYRGGKKYKLMQKYSVKRCSVVVRRIMQALTKAGIVESKVNTTGCLWCQGKLANKVVSAMTSAANAIHKEAPRFSYPYFI
jgi:ribosomal protein S19E (S16A)